MMVDQQSSERMLLPGPVGDPQVVPGRVEDPEVRQAPGPVLEILTARSPRQACQPPRRARRLAPEHADYSLIPHVRVLAVVHETWTRAASFAVESPEGARHSPEFCATTW